MLMLEIFSAFSKNPDLCLSVDYRHDGRFYAVALANGLVNVYNSRTDNILYTLNKGDKDLPYTDVSATCVRFRPFHTTQAEDEAGSFMSSQLRSSRERRKSSGAASGDSDFFLPPISSARSSQQYSQRRRKSSVSALGLRSIADELGLVPSVDKTLPNNIVTASCKCFGTFVKTVVFFVYKTNIELTLQSQMDR
ncbi:unnamed protein product [Orchesella dallaii]|uniref:Uncharacterized protein n=1 Tax=Orchesella dallaii TaxID=48710 RepID=A0ABP1R6X7_9HEXA